MSVRSVLVCAFLLQSVAGSAAAAATDLHGRVEDHTGAAIGGASIVVACPNDARSTVTDLAGRFEIRNLPAARCTVAGSHANFATTMVDVDLGAGGRVATRLVLPVQTLDASVVVTTSGGVRENAAAVPSGVSVVTARDLALRPYQVLPQVLREEPGVVVQQTTAAAGSPIIRGFTGQSNIYLIDGVRLNTSMWRSGPVQYAAWLGTSNVDRIELVRGPMSVQYGSDALGGAINVIQARPAFSAAGVTFGGSFEAFAASADSSSGVDGTFVVRSPRAAIAISGLSKTVGDLRAGGAKDSHAAVTRYFGLESTVLADRLRSTGYQQRGLQLNGQARVGRDGILSGFYRREGQDGISRYDRLEGGEGLFRSEIDPQRFDFGVLRYERAAVPVVGAIRATFSLNHQRDDTLEQARPGARINSDSTEVLALGYQAQATRRFAGHVLTFGAELFDEYIDAARAQETNGVVTPLRPLIPDGTRYTTTGAFAQAVSRELAGRLSLRGGLRYNRYNYRTTNQPAFAINAEDVTFDALTYNGAATLRLAEAWRASFSVSRGFRAANASDLGAIGVSGGGGFEIAPSAAGALGGFVGTTDSTSAVSTGEAAGDLRPESELAYEAGLRYTTRRVTAAVTLFDLELYDAINRRALIFTRDVVGTVISGREIVRQDEQGRAYIAIDPRPIATRANAGRARIRGLDADVSVQFTDRWSSRAWFSMANGEDLDTGAYMRRMNPPMGGAVLAWQSSPRGLRVEGTLQFARTQTRLASGDLTDARIGARRTPATIATYFNGTATDIGLVRDGILQPTGETLAQVQARVLAGSSSSDLFASAPGYVAVGLRGMYPLTSKVDLVVIGENLTDRNYRLIGSGVDAAGRNAQVRLRLRF